MGWSLATVPLLILLNAFFVAAEYAVVAVRESQIELLRRRGRRAAADAMKSLKADPAGAIGAIQVCITMTNLLLGWLGEPAMSALLTRAFGGLLSFLPESVFRLLSLATAFIVVTLATVVFSELLPKALTLRYVLVVATLTATPIRLILLVARPLVWLMNVLANSVTVPLKLGRVDVAEVQAMSVEEIRIVATEAAAAGNLSIRERSLILNSLSLGRRSAREIMVPRVKIAYLDLRRDMQANRAILEERLFSRLPLCDGGMDQVVGIITTREFLLAETAGGDVGVLRLLARPPVFAPETIPLDSLLVLFDQGHTQMVLLVDEHGGVEGLVTLRDVVDELVGEPLSLQMSATTELAGLEVAGDLSLHDLAERLGREDWGVNESVVTVAGLITRRLGRFPTIGDSIVEQGVRLEVLAADGRTVRLARITAEPPSLDATST